MAIASIAPGEKFVPLRSQLINWSVLSAQRGLLWTSKADGDSAAHAEATDAVGDDAEDGGDDQKGDSDHSEDEETNTTPKRRRARSTQVETLIPFPPPPPLPSSPLFHQHLIHPPCPP